MPEHVHQCRQDDILWKFYCKRFTIEGKEIEPPKSLCPYFWTSVNGFGLWLGREVRLRTFGFICLAAIMIPFILYRLVPLQNPRSPVFLTISGILGTVLTLTLFVCSYRLERFIMKRAPWAIYLFGSCIIAIPVIHATLRGTLLREAQRFFSDVSQAIGYLFAMAIVVLVGTLVLSFIPHERFQGFRRAFKTVGDFLAAKKNKFCPPVNPPEGFK